MNEIQNLRPSQRSALLQLLQDKGGELEAAGLAKRRELCAELNAAKSERDKNAANYAREIADARADLAPALRRLAEAGAAVDALQNKVYIGELQDLGDSCRFDALAHRIETALRKDAPADLDVAINGFREFQSDARLKNRVGIEIDRGVVLPLSGFRKTPVSNKHWIVAALDAAQTAIEALEAAKLRPLSAKDVHELIDRVKREVDATGARLGIAPIYFKFDEVTV